MFNSAFNASARLTLAMGAVLALTGCEIDPQQYQFGFNITGIEFVLYNQNVGIHPNQDVLLDENNPFAETGVGAETKFQILASGGNAGGFYAWATLLAQQPNGEHQFYTAIKLRDLSESGELDAVTSSKVRDMAVRGFQAQLDFFPEAVTYDASGTISTRLATFSYNEILGLGGVVQGDWVLVATPAGGTAAVRSSTVDPGRAEETQDDS